jgi:hypothetical protein
LITAKNEIHENESGFAYFEYFAVPSLFYIGMVFEALHFSRTPLTFGFIRRGLGMPLEVRQTRYRFFAVFGGIGSGHGWFRLTPTGKETWMPTKATT